MTNPLSPALTTQVPQATPHVHPTTPLKPVLNVWFSCGAASAVAAKEALARYANDFSIFIVNCDTRSSEHSDNYRFTRDCETWFGIPIIFIRNPDYASIDDVFITLRYMSGIKGARCTTELKKKPRLTFASPDDTHVFGFTFDEQKRARDFTARNPELNLRWPLIEAKITKQDCYRALTEAGIKLPEMYSLGFDNNNCPGCVKATSPWYWAHTRKHFPDVFKRRAEQSRALGVRLVRLKGERIFLDELPEGAFKQYRKTQESLSCGPECGGPP